MRLRRIAITVAVLGILGLAAWMFAQAFLKGFTGTGTTAVERWVGRQLAAIANAHLGPTLSFDRLGYAYPRTVTLHNVALTAEGIPIITAVALRIEFAEVPRSGRPIVLESVRFQGPVVRLIEQDGGRLLGFSDFVKAGAGEVTPDGGSTRLSDVLAIERIEVAGGAVHYEQPGRPAMRLRPLTFALQRDAQVASDAQRDPGWYAFDAKLALEPVARLNLDALINLDTAVMEITSADLTTNLTKDRYEIFTPELQEVLRAYAVVGELVWTLKGRVPLGDTAATALESNLRLSDASMSFGSYVLPLDSLEISAGLGEGVLDLSSVAVKALGGTADAAMKLDVAGPDTRTFDGWATASDLNIGQALRLPEGVAPDVTGDLDFNVQVKGSFDNLAGTFAGSGDVLVDNGHFRFIDLFRNLLKLKGKRSDRDRATAEFALTGDRVRWSNLKLSGDLLGISGSGDLYYEGRLDLMVAAGPLHGRRGVVGFFGDIIGSVTSRLVAYRVTGTVEQPKIDVAPLEVGGVKGKTGE